MKLFHKVSSGIFTITALLLTLSSCNVPESLPTVSVTPERTSTPLLPSATPTQKPTPTATPVPEYLEVKSEDLSGTIITLRYNLDGEVRDHLKDLVKSFNEENPQGITVQAIEAFSKDELGESIHGETNLVIADSDWLRSIDADKNLYLELSDFMEDKNLSLESEDITPIMPVMLETENRNGDIYALPLWTEPAFLFYNKTWAIELGYPETPTDLASFAEQVCAAGKANYSEKDDGKHGTGGWIISSDPEDVISWLLVFTRNGETPGQILQNNNSNIFEEAAAWLRNLYDNGCAWNSRIKEPYDYFANRYALFYSGTYSDAERQYNAFKQSEDHAFDNWDLVIYPTRTGESSDSRIYADMVSIAILNDADAKSTNAAWQFIRWLYSHDHAAELALTASGWPVQDNEAITKLYRNSGKDKLYLTLSYRQYLAASDTDETWLTDRLILSDGFAYIFNPSAKPEDIPEIREQIGSLIAEIHSVNLLSAANNSESTIDTGVNNETQP